MKMNSNDDPLARSLPGMDDETISSAEAEIARRKQANWKVDPANFREDASDPLGIDWAWAGGTPKEQGDTHVAVPKQPAQTPLVKRSNRRLLYGSVGVLAASLLILAGVLIDRGIGDRGGDTFALDVNPVRVQLLGTEQPQPTIQPPFNGFVAALTVNGEGDVTIWPSEGDRAGLPVTVQKDQVVRVGPLARDVQQVIVVVSEQPATDALIQAFGSKRVKPDQIADLEQAVTDTLRKLNYRHLGIGRVDYSTTP